MALVLTGWSGVEFANIAAQTLPITEAYARRHGHRFACVNLSGPRPPSWQKVPAIYSALQSHDRVVWIDADVVIVRHDADIVAELPDGQWQALVEHDTPSGQVPNCGAWVLSQHMLPVLKEAWESGDDLQHPWWEQAAILRRMGYSVSDVPTACVDSPSTLYERTTLLAAEWNHHPYDSRRVGEPRFVHVTQYADRLGEIRKLCELAVESLVSDS